MAPETRIGLVVGLAFIVCFAIILANRGQRPPSVLLDPAITEVTYPARGGQPASRIPATPASLHSSHPIRDAMQSTGNTTAQSAPVRIDREIPYDPADSVASTGGNVVYDDDPSWESESSRTGGVGSGWVEDPREMSSGDGRDASSYASSQAIQTSPQGALTAGSPGGGDPVQRQRPHASEKQNSSGQGRALVAPGQSTVTGRTHEVVAGDTLSGLASRYFGTRSAHAVDAIFEANRAVLSSPDSIRIGMELAIPTLDGASTVTTNTATSAPATMSALPRAGNTSASVPEGNVRWYQIKPSDRYMSIARTELGDVSRWTEIHELNKDKFPDAGRIRAGVRIKLPPRARASTGGR